MQKTRLKPLIKIILIFLVYSGFVSLVIAQAPPTIGDFSNFIVRLINVFFAFTAIIFLFLLIFIGVTWMISQGDEEKLAEVRKRLTYWVIGFVVLAMAVPLVTFVYDIFNVKNCIGERPVPGFDLILDRGCPQTFSSENSANAQCGAGNYLQCVNTSGNGLFLCKVDAADNCAKFGLRNP